MSTFNEPSVDLSENDFVGIVNECHKAFIEKLIINASDSSFPFWLSSAALILGANAKDADLEGKLIHADYLAKVVKEGFEQMENWLDDLPEEERCNLEYSKTYFEETFIGKVGLNESTTVDARRAITVSFEPSTCHKCEACAEDSDLDDEIPPAVIYCIGCKMKLCFKCRRYHKKLKIDHDVQALEDLQKVSDLMSEKPKMGAIQLYDLPLEMLDMILQKSYLHWILNSQIKQRDEEVIRYLLSVDVCFYQRITRKRFKRKILRLWKDFYGETRKRSAIISSNRNYLLENIQPNDELIASLLHHNCITQEQSRFIQRQRSNQDKNAEQRHLIWRQSSDRNKNDELLDMTRSFDEMKFLAFVKCLRQNKQQTVARIIEKGGGATKTELHSRGAKCTASKDLQLLHQKFEDLRNETKPWSDKTYKFMSQLNKEGIEILNSQQKRQTVIVWIFCRSQTALKNTQKLYESDELRDVFFENIQTPNSTVICIDRSQFRKTIAVCAISRSFTQIIQLHEYIKDGFLETQKNRNLYLSGVTKLRNEIYILFASPQLPLLVTRVIHVFEDQTPFNWKKEIELDDIGKPNDIESNARENCLYVSDLFLKCVWKIAREEDGGHKIIQWLDIDYMPRGLSVTTDGQLMVLNKFFLMIYGSDAELFRDIPLPRDIKKPRHAVETSIGNFIILHNMRIQSDGKSVFSDSSGESDSSDSSAEEILTKWCISELSREGQMVIRRFIPSNETQLKLKEPDYLSIDSEDRVFVVGSGNNRVILLDSDLRWNRILIPTGEKEETESRWPNRLCYDEEKKQLIVGGEHQLNVYSISWK